jgi:hypothetical protein
LTRRLPEETDLGQSGVSIRDDPEKVGRAIREFLKVDDDRQKQAARQDRAFDFWRRTLEENDILVFVISGLIALFMTFWRRPAGES